MNRFRMNLQIITPSKRFVAALTSKIFCSFVNCSYMSLQIPIVSKNFGAFVACKVPILLMNRFLMSLQNSIQPKIFLAFVAMKILGSLPRESFLYVPANDVSL